VDAKVAALHRQGGRHLPRMVKFVLPPNGFAASVDRIVTAPVTMRDFR
jgi:hypothetical protein